MFPIEVVELILQQVRLLDWESIKECTLVSPDFHGVARRILFQEVSLDLEPNPAGSSVPHASQFLEFLSRDPQVAFHIRGLSIDRKQVSWAKDAPTDWQATADKLALLVPKLTCLRSLHVQSNFIADWTLRNDDLRKGIMKLCRLPLDTLDISYMTLNQNEILSFIGVPKLSLCCIDILSSANSSLPAANNAIQLQDLTITTRYSDNRSPEIWSIMKAARHSLTSLKCYSSPFDTCLLTTLEEIDLRMYPSLRSFAICIPLVSEESVARLVSMFSQYHIDSGASHPHNSTINHIEIRCDVDVYNFPSSDLVPTWNWAALDSLLSSAMYDNLERVEITVKTVIRSRTARPRRLNDLKKKLLALFKDHLPVASHRGLIVGAGTNSEVVFTHIL